MAKAMRHQQALGMVEMNGGERYDLPQASGNVGQESPTRQVEIGGGNLPHSSQAGKDGMQLDDRERRQEVMRTRLGEKSIYLGGARFRPVVLGRGAGIEKAIGHPGLHDSAFLTFGMHQLRDGAGCFGESLTHGFKADRRIGTGKPIGILISAFNRNSQVLVFLQRGGNGAQGTQHPVFVHDFDSFTHDIPPRAMVAQPRAAVERFALPQLDMSGVLPYIREKRGTMMPTEPNRTARIEARIAPDALAVVKRAAEILGRSVSDFVVAAAQEAAHRTIEEAHLIRLSVEDQHRFADCLLNPPKPSAALTRAKKAHARLIRKPKA